MPSKAKAEWEQVSHTKGVQQVQSTGESWEPFSRLTGLAGSEQGPCSLGTPLKLSWGFLPALWVMHAYEAWNLTGTWLKCFQHRKRCGAQMLWLSAVQRINLRNSATFSCALLQLDKWRWTRTSLLPNSDDWEEFCRTEKKILHLDRESPTPHNWEENEQQPGDSN